ncbi:sensor histidine kinase [Saccharothrix sp. S26]|uniref:sensor histidine kinase n=1 Tax=Saccharothrix sp. S26 TaxID=2907215 RepID=UPI001F3FCBFE|nr:sensor histidine kinase [Saccharothrix sp. S26]MCE6996363.1 sensor histidine kinase [Saccharothrix sp. S26]
MSLPEVVSGFRHEALFYSSREEFLDGAVPFIEGGVAEGGPVLVVVDREKIGLLRTALGAGADRVDFADMAEVGRNPARIIPLWRRFVDRNLVDGKPVRGIGEPLWAGRSSAEVVECQAHETLLNTAFGDGSAWSLLCPYDVAALDAQVVDEARRSHPSLIADGVRTSSADYVFDHPSPARWDHRLDPPPVGAAQCPFASDRGSPAAVRRFVRDHATATPLDRAAVERVVLTVNELVTNSVVHGGGHGVVRLWRDGDTLVCEVRDAGTLVADPLTGRRAPTGGQPGGRGLWLVNQLCDLVQVRTAPESTVVRTHHRLTAPHC